MGIRQSTRLKRVLGVFLLCFDGIIRDFLKLPDAKNLLQEGFLCQDYNGLSGQIQILNHFVNLFDVWNIA